MPIGMGVVEPVGLTLYVDDWARTVRKWSALLGAEATVRDFADDGRKRARFASRSFVTFDLVEAGLDVAIGDARLTLLCPDVAASVAAVRKTGASVEVDKKTGDARIPAATASGVEVILAANRPPAVGQPIMPLPYVVDISVDDIDAATPIWDAIMGLGGTSTSIETDSARQFEMRHYVCAGEAHALGLMRIPKQLHIKRDSLGASHRWIMREHGAGVLCVGFLLKDNLDRHIEAIPAPYRDLLLFEEPRSYQMGRNNLTHAEDTGGFSVVIAQHYEGWSGDPREARAKPAK
jgi:hypothetical protein